LSALPLGFSARFGQGRVRPFADIHGGIIASTEPVPVDAPDATGLNFIFDVGAGLRFKTGPRTAVNVGYKYLHISNGYTTGFNPGLDNNVLFAGISFLR
jgi:opacity protein-like surface antigen